MTIATKCYPHVTGVYGDSGVLAGALAVHAVLDPSPDYPDSGRIIVGSPGTTPSIPGYLPNLGGFSGGPDAIERLASTLLEASRDARAATGQHRSSDDVPPDDRPSIAELLRIEHDEDHPLQFESAVAHHGHVLLEIAAAALARDIAMAKIVDEKGGVWDELYAADDRLRAALAKVIS